MQVLKFKRRVTKSRNINIRIPKYFGDQVEIILLPSLDDCFQKKIILGESYIPASGKLLDEEDLHNLMESSLDMWLTAGRFAEKFEEEFSNFLGVKYCSLTNSGSSANLLAISALTSYKLGERRLKKGDEVITVAACFPTTITPVIQNGLVPVFVDIDIGTYNIDVSKIDQAISEKTKAIFIAHTLGNPFDLDRVGEICKRYNLWLIEDNCDALGSKFNSHFTGTFGHLATHSFYPAHHITMGEGGAVVTNDKQLYRIVNSFRDWGRDCWCPPGKDNTCGKRFKWQLGNLSYGYDHKYIYSHLGYNLKVTDMQAAVGLSQLKKLPFFIEKRRENWQRLYAGLKEFEDFLILPQTTENSEPSWFGFVVSVRANCGFSKNDLVNYLESNKIGTRVLFAGNIIKQPAFTEQNIEYRVYRKLKNTDFVMENIFWIGVWPGLDTACIDYMIEKFGEFFNQ